MKELSPLVKRDPVTGEPLRKSNGTYKYFRSPTGVCECGNRNGKRRPMGYISCDDCEAKDERMGRHQSVPPVRDPRRYAAMQEHHFYEPSLA
jgi:hypothetical protein